MIKKMLQSIREYKFPTILSSITVALEVFVEILIPYATANFIDLGIEKGNMGIIYKFGLYLFLLSVGQISFGVLSGRLSAVASAGFASNLRKDIFNKIQEFSFSNIDKFSQGSLVSRLTTDITNIQTAFQMIIRLAVRAVMLLIFAIMATYRINARIGKVFLIIVPIMCVSFGIIIKFAFPLFNKMFKGYDDLNNVLSENLRGIRVVKTFNREDYENKKFKNISEYIYTIGLTAERLVALWGPIMNIAIYATSISILYFGAKAIIASGNDITKGMTTGSLMSLVTYSIQILMSLMMVSMIFVMIIIAASSAKRIYEVLTEKIDIKNNNVHLTEVKNGSIEFRNVSFAYNENANNMVLKNIDLKIDQGLRVGIMGMTGSGKTSLVSLISRFYDTSSGDVLVGNVNVKDYDLKALRSSIGMVLQKNVLFKGTIRSNLEFGKKNASDEELNEALKIAEAYEFVMEKEAGLNSIVEQGGSNFSGGQRQRLCIARAIVKKPKILILDDSTSAVDTATDAKIRKALNEYYKDTTVIIIAQRISSIIDCDKIVVLDNGYIENIGTHEELLKTSNIYKETYELQMKGGLE